MGSNGEIRKLLTVREVSELTGWRQATIRQKIWLRKLEYVRLQGRSIRLKSETVERLIAEGTVPALPNRK